MEDLRYSSRWKVISNCINRFTDLNSIKINLLLNFNVALGMSPFRMGMRDETFYICDSKNYSKWIARGRDKEVFILSIYNQDLINAYFIINMLQPGSKVVHVQKD